MAQIVLGTVGAVAGFFIGGPTGALIGFNIGASLGASMSETTVQGNKIGDVADQTANEGDPRPIIWGRVRPIGGQLIACSDPKIVKVKHKQSGGKGGGGSTTTVTESVYRTYAMAVCEGPITGFVRIWRNNELVYDARGNDWGAENNGAFLGTATLYLGVWDQMPDPALEGVFGVGEVPPHRGTAYMVMNHELLDDTGGAIPQWIFEVERAEGVYLTSKLYPVEIYEGVLAGGVVDVRESPQDFSVHNIVADGAHITTATLTQVMFWRYYTQEQELVKSLGASIINAQLIYNATIIESYATQPDQLLSPGSSVVDASLLPSRIEYNIYYETISSGGATVIGVTLL